MGSYSYLRVEGHEILSYKNEWLDPLPFTLFRESDRRVVEKKKRGEASLSFWGYRVSAQVARDRLALMGFSDRTLRLRFREGLDSELAETRAALEDEDSDSDWGRHLQEDVTQLEALTYDKWLSAFAEALNSPAHERHRHGEDWLRNRISDEETLFGLRNFDELAITFAALQVLPRVHFVTLDLTDSMEGGYLDEDRPWTDWAIRELAGNYPVTQSTLVLTEGPTDSEFLRESFAVLFPHLASYFSVFDFAASRSPGGVGPLLTMVKTLAGAGIANRVVAVLDNDAAAEAAIRTQLKELKLPARFRVVRHPDTALAANYPAIGPDGITRTNVNGRAASIELYLGRDVLTGSDGKLVPIQWRGYEESLKRYQGEILAKQEIHERFRSKMAAAKRTSRKPRETGWKEMRQLLLQILHAFDDA